MSIKEFGRGDAINEKSDVQYQCVFKEAAPGQPQLVLAALTEIKLTISDVKTGTIINGRNAVNVKNANGGSVASDGTFTMQLDGADMAFVDQANTEEQHRLVLDVTYTRTAGGIGTLKHEVRFFIKNIGNIT